MKKIIAFLKSLTTHPKRLQLQNLNSTEHSNTIVTRKYKAEVMLTFNGIRVAKFPVRLTAVNSKAAKNEILYKLGFEVLNVKQEA